MGVVKEKYSNKDSYEWSQLESYLTGAIIEQAKEVDQA